MRLGLDFRASSVGLEVEDDGVGFDASALAQSGDQGRGWGIMGMQERAALLGGALQVLSEPGNGTRVKVTVPLEGGAKP